MQRQLLDSKMSSKWRALQRRHRWTYESVFLPSSYVETLNNLSPSISKLRFFDEIRQFASLGSIHSQVTAVKRVVAAFSELFLNSNTNEEAVHAAVPLYLEIVFQENSPPLHRSLLSFFSNSFPVAHQSLVKECFELLCKVYGLMGNKFCRFALAPVATCILCLPKAGFLKEVAEQCSMTMVLNACIGLQSVMKEADEGGRPSPAVMEQCQEAMSSLYYLIQQFPHKFAPQDIFDDSAECPDPHSEGPAVNEIAVKTIIDVLKSSVFSRDCIVAAGVSFCAAAQICIADPELALLLSTAIFHQPGTGFAIVTPEQGIVETSHQGWLEAKVTKLFKRDLAEEVQHFTDFGRLCLLRGILTAIPRSVLNKNLLLLRKDIDVGESKPIDTSKGGSTEERVVWTILFDGILPLLCNLCESSVDSHFNFHAVTALQICLQQIKASVLADLTATAEGEFHHAAKLHSIAVKPYETFPEFMVSRILKIIWNNWEDPLNQTVKQVQVVFELLIDVHSIFFKTSKRNSVQMNVKAESEEKSNTTGTFLNKIASDLLLVGGHRKGRYVPLATLGQRLGAKNLLSMSPNLLFETVQAYMDDDVCCAATLFLKCFLERLREDCWSSEGGVEEGYRAFRRLWIPPILAGLVSGFSKLRSNLNTYALPVALQIDGDGIFPMLAFIFNHDTTRESMNGIFSWAEIDRAVGLPGALTDDQNVAATISLLKVARSLALLEGDIEWYCNPSVLSDNNDEIRQEDNGLAVVCVKGSKVHVPVEWLKFALTHTDDLLRIDAAELLFLNPKTSSLVSSLELSLMRMAIPLNMRCSSTGFRMKWTSLFRKFFSRVRTAIERQMKQTASKLCINGSSDVCRDGIETGSSQTANYKNDNKSILEGVRELDRFMKWLGRLLVSSLYPSAPYERKSMAMELFLVMINVWPIHQLPKQESSQCALSSSLGTSYYHPYDQGLLLADSTLVVVGAIVDSWDKLRENAFRILIQFPTPLPGITNKVTVIEVIRWSKTLVSSPRVRESDAGALTLRLIFRKYVQELGWTVKIAQDHVSESELFEPHLLHKSARRPEENNLNRNNVGTPVGEYIQSLIDWLNMGIEEGEKDLVKACEHSFVHGILLTLRYTIEELDWTSEATRASASQLQAALERLLGLVVRVTSLALWVVSVDALDMPENIESFIDDIQSGNQTLSVDIKEPETTNGLQEEDTKDIETVGPVEQVVMVGCWLAMKELSLLLGTIARKVPLPGCSSGIADSSNGENEAGKLVNSVKQFRSFDAMLDLRQLEIIGDHFLQVLLAMKHNGAIDKTRAGFTALCNRLLCSSDPRINQMPELWMKQLMQRTIAKGQTVDDLLRRSAGIPAAFIALFLAEPEGTPKKLLPSALRWLIDIVKSFLLKSGALSGSLLPKNDLVSLDEESKLQSLAPAPFLFPPDIRCVELGASKSLSKQRDEGVVPTVHAFNVLKVAFHDTNLSTDTSGFCAEALITAIRSFSCHYWEVRNSATLAFTALVHRMIGFLNVHKRESARRAMTGFEFFHRYPTLHPFLLEELLCATEQLEESVSQSWNGSNLGKSLHPSLGAVLIILSRFKPSTISSGSEDWLNPSAFMPYVRRCATQRNLKVRILASKALAPLVSSENLLNTLHDIASGLPRACSQTTNNEVVNSAPKALASFGNVGPSCRASVSFNAIHGILLQMDSLLSTNCMIIPDMIEKHQIVSTLLPVLQSCLWLGSVKLCSCPVVISFYLKVLEDLLKIEETCPSGSHISTIQNMLISLSSECLDASVVCETEFFDCTRTDLRQQAAAFYFNAIVPRIGFDMQLSVLDSSCKHEDSERFLERLKGCLSDSTYEVRLVSFKVLKQLLKSLESDKDNSRFGTSIENIYQWLQINLQPMLIECLELEKNPNCLRSILQIFFLCNSLECLNSSSLIGEDQTNLCWADYHTVLNLWCKLVTLQGTSRHGKTQEILICCLGVCIKRLRKFIRDLILSGFQCHEANNYADHDIKIEKSEQWKTTYQCICTWIALIKKYSNPCQSVNMRKATAEGIIASGLLEEVSWIGSKISNREAPIKMICCRKYSVKSTGDQEEIDLYARAILDTWFTCIKLIEDEDVNLRQKLAVALVRSMSSTSCKSTVKNVVPTQVERVLELCFDFLTDSFNQWLVYFDYLADRVLGSEVDSIFMTRNGDLVRRLFDKELDNHHEERLLISQLCCLHLQKQLNAQVLNSEFEGTEISFATNLDQDAHFNYQEEIKVAHFNYQEETKVFIHTWRMKFLSKTILFAKHCNELESSLSWVGGIINHQDVFKILYPCLLGLYAFSFHPFGKERNDLSQKCSEELSSRLNELTELMDPLLSNPLISNLYIMLLQVYENQFIIDLGSKDLQNLRGTAWSQDFDPYFLVK